MDEIHLYIIVYVTFLCKTLLPPKAFVYKSPKFWLDDTFSHIKKYMYHERKMKLF